jgi:hypothetical protein
MGLHRMVETTRRRFLTEGEANPGYRRGKIE